MTLEQVKALIKKRETASVEVGPVNFDKLVEWSKGEEFMGFLTVSDLVRRAYVRVGDDTILFHVGVDILITKAG